MMGTKRIEFKRKRIVQMADRQTSKNIAKETGRHRQENKEREKI